MSEANVTPNDVLRFFLELAVLAAVSYWGFRAADGAGGWALGIGAPVLVAIFWGTVMSPKSTRRPSDPLYLALEVAVFGLGALALLAAGATTLGIVLAALAALHLTLTVVLGERDRAG